MENQFEHQLYDLYCQIARQVAREEILLASKDQSNLAGIKSLSSEHTARELPAINNEKQSLVKWLLPCNGIDIVHSVLVNKEKLLCPVENFRALFLMPDAAPVKWYGKNGELACLLGTFKSRNVVSTSESYWETITSFFNQPDNETFSHASLCSQYSQSQYSDEFENLIIEIIKKLKSEFRDSLTGVKSS